MVVSRARLKYLNVGRGLQIRTERCEGLKTLAYGGCCRRREGVRLT